MRIIQVGLGGFGRDWAERVLPQVPEAEVVGTADVFAASRERAVAAGLTSAEDCYASVEEALEATDAEAVLVTASLVGHVPAARAALSAGRHVLVEKPFAPSVAEAKELIELADAQNLTIAVSQNYRFFPAVQAVSADRRRADLRRPPRRRPRLPPDVRSRRGARSPPRAGGAAAWWTCRSTTST